MCIVGRFLFFLFFFFKQKTAYEMRISDWSSDVCSSDLIGAARGVHRVAISAVPVGVENQGFTAVASLQRRAAADRNIGTVEVLRSEERRVGKECVSTCRSRWSPYH